MPSYRQSPIRRLFRRRPSFVGTKVSTGRTGQLQVRVAGTFVHKPTLVRVSGTFVAKPVEVRVGGAFQNAT